MSSPETRAPGRYLLPEPDRGQILVIDQLILPFLFLVIVTIVKLFDLI